MEANTYTNARTELLSAIHEVSERDIRVRDMFKPPALITMGGLALVLDGCRHIETLEGVNKIAVGRGCDLLDGFMARRLKMESDAGSLADATADKIGMLAIGAAAYKHDVAPKTAIASMLGSNLLNAGLTTVVGLRSKESMRPTWSGKIGMAAFNTGIISHLYAHALEKDHPDLDLHPHFTKLGSVAIAAGQALSVPTAIQYAKRIG